jgi:hypothetical protein
MAFKLIHKGFEFLQRIKFKLGIDRKSFVLRHIKENQCRNILEIGVFNGNFALRIISTASKFIDPQAINYSGVDLFKLNFSNEIKFNEIALTPDKKSDVQKSLESTGANINLFEGFSDKILPQLVGAELFDLIIIDGGHSYDTVKSDFLNSTKLLSNKGCIIFDDYTNSRGETIGKFGINRVVREIDRSKFDVRISYNRDYFWKSYGLLTLRMVKVCRY